MEQLEHSAEKLGEFSASREVRSLKSKKWWSCRSGWIILAHIRITRRYTWHSGHSTFRVAVRSDVHFRIIKSVPFIHVANIYFVDRERNRLHRCRCRCRCQILDNWWRTNSTTARSVRSRNVLHYGAVLLDIPTYKSCAVIHRHVIDSHLNALLDFRWHFLRCRRLILVAECTNPKILSFEDVTRSEILEFDEVLANESNQTGNQKSCSNWKHPSKTILILA